MNIFFILLAGQINLTVYNNNLGLVKDVREFQLKKGVNTVYVTDVASLIDPTSLGFKAKEVNILEQNYEYDLISSSKLLTKYLNKGIEVFPKDGSIEKGKLLSFDNESITLSTSEGVSIMQKKEITRTQLPKLPEGLITTPTLVWLVDAKNSGKKKCELSYLTDGINWHAEYVGITTNSSMDFSGWVTIDNKSGAAYKDAKLKLVAGEVHRVKPVIEEGWMRKRAPGTALEIAAPRFEERAFFEYHIYDLQGIATVKDNQEKQIRFVGPTQVKTKKVYLYDGGKNAKVKLEFKNSKDAGLGIPLPMGKVRVYKEDIDKSLVFVGEDEIKHTPRDEKVRLYIGDAFDIIGERKVVERRKITDRVREEDVEIEIRNHKKEEIIVKVVEKLYGYWEIKKSSHEYEKKDANTIEFDIKVPKNKKEKITYTALYSW